MTNAWHYFNTKLPKYFQQGGDGSDYQDDIKTVITQLAQLTAWTWTSLLTENGREKREQEQKLKEYYSTLLQDLAMKTTVFEHYDGIRKDKVRQESEKLKSLFLGQSVSGIDQFMTLDRVLGNLSHKRFVFTEKQDFTKKFVFLAKIGISGGTMIDPWEDAQDDAPADDLDRFLLYLCVAPRPALSEYTITESQLLDWAINGGDQGQYIPPAFLPLGAS